MSSESHTVVQGLVLLCVLVEGGDGGDKRIKYSTSPYLQPCTPSVTLLVAGPLGPRSNFEEKIQSTICPGFVKLTILTSASHSWFTPIQPPDVYFIFK